MSNLLSSLRSTTDALRAFQAALDVTQNNVVNASTPGYARQRAVMTSECHQTEAGYFARLTITNQSARDLYAEQNVRLQQQELGRSDARAELLNTLESIFPVSGTSGIPDALTKLFNSFSTWSTTPNDGNARRSVLDNAASVALTFNETAAQLEQASQGADLQISQAIEHINRLAATLRDGNERVRRGDGNAGVDAQIHASLEELAQLVDVTVLPTADGTFTVLAGNTPLVVGEQCYTLSAEPVQPDETTYPEGPPQIAILDQYGRDVTSQMNGGRLDGLLEIRNESISELLGDANQVGSLNQLATAFAAHVNELLASGQNAAGESPTEDFFLFDTDKATGVARNLSVNSAFTADMLGAVDPGPPSAANGIALKLAALATPDAEEDMIQGASYIEFYGGMAAGIGRDLDNAEVDKDLGSQLVTQARNLRNQTSGVSLDEEAMLLMQYQRAYQAAARMVTVIADLTEATVNLIR